MMEMNNIDRLKDEIRERTKLTALLDKYNLSRTLFRSIFLIKKEGYTNKEIAQKIGIHVATVNRYTKKAHSMLESEYNYLSDKLLGDYWN